MSTDFPLIQRFQDAEIVGDGCDPEALAHSLDGRLANWTRRPELEARLEIDSTYRYLVYERGVTADSPNVNLFLCQSDEGMRVANIVPVEAGSIDADQYNFFLTEFIDNGLEPASGALECEVRVSSSTYDLRQEFGAEAAELLRRFSRTANKSTGSAHPSDRDRWLDFLVAVHAVDEAKGYASLVGDWLQLDGWTDEVAVQLELQFEFAMDLLDRVDAS